MQTAHSFTRAVYSIIAHLFSYSDYYFDANNSFADLCQPGQCQKQICINDAIILTLTSAESHTIKIGT